MLKHVFIKSVLYIIDSLVFIDDGRSFQLGEGAIRHPHQIL